MTAPALRLSNLSVSFPAGSQRSTVVKALDLSVAPGATLGLVGESGSGKSVTLRALMGSLPLSAAVESGSLEIGGQGVPLAGRGSRAARRRRMAMVFQDPLAALDPVLPVGDQIAEVPRRVFGQSARAFRSTALDLLRLVRMDQPEVRAKAYPHQLSGGQRQRVVIAMALACQPEILLCDEPTTALDVTVQAEILALLRNVQERSGLSMVFVSHDLAVVASMADEILVLRAGALVEAGATGEVLDRPRAGYTRQLVNSVLELPPVRPDREPRPAAGAGAFGDFLGTERTMLLSARDVVVEYGSGVDRMRAVDGVSLAVARGRIHGLSVNRDRARRPWPRCSPARCDKMPARSGWTAPLCPPGATGASSPPCR